MVNVDKREEITSYCTFYINSRMFGADILDVKEINDKIKFTNIHHAPSQIEGYVNIRGRIHLILNLRKVFKFKESTITNESRLVLFNQSVGTDFGVLVDKIGDIVEVGDDRIEDRRKGEIALTADDTERRMSQAGLGVCKLEEGLMVVLSARNLLNYVYQLKK